MEFYLYKKKSVLGGEALRFLVEGGRKGSLRKGRECHFAQGKDRQGPLHEGEEIKPLRFPIKDIGEGSLDCPRRSPSILEKGSLQSKEKHGSISLLEGRKREAPGP